MDSDIFSTLQVPIGEKAQHFVLAACVAIRGNFKEQPTKELMPVILVNALNDEVKVIAIPEMSLEIKHQIRRLIDKELWAGADMVVFVTEAWVAKREKDEPLEGFVPRLDPNHTEAVVLNIYFPNGRRVIWHNPIAVQPGGVRLLGKFNLLADSADPDRQFTAMNFE